MGKICPPDGGVGMGWLLLDGTSNILLRWNDDTAALEIWKGGVGGTLLLQLKANSIVLPDAATDGTKREFGSLAKDQLTGTIVGTDSRGDFNI